MNEPNLDLETEKARLLRSVNNGMDGCLRGFIVMGIIVLTLCIIGMILS